MGLADELRKDLLESRSEQDRIDGEFNRTQREMARIDETKNAEIKELQKKLEELREDGKICGEQLKTERKTIASTEKQQTEMAQSLKAIRAGILSLGEEEKEALRLANEAEEKIKQLQQRQKKNRASASILDPLQHRAKEAEINVCLLQKNVIHANLEKSLLSLRNGFHLVNEIPRSSTNSGAAGDWADCARNFQTAIDALEKARKEQDDGWEWLMREVEAGKSLASLPPVPPLANLPDVILPPLRMLGKDKSTGDNEQQRPPGLLPTQPAFNAAGDASVPKEKPKKLDIIAQMIKDGFPEEGLVGHPLLTEKNYKFLLLRVREEEGGNFGRLGLEEIARRCLAMLAGLETPAESVVQKETSTQMRAVNLAELTWQKRMMECDICEESLMTSDRAVECERCGACQHRHCLSDWVQSKPYCPGCQTSIQIDAAK